MAQNENVEMTTAAASAPPAFTFTPQQAAHLPPLPQGQMLPSGGGGGAAAGAGGGADPARHGAFANVYRQIMAAEAAAAAARGGAAAAGGAVPLFAPLQEGANQWREAMARAAERRGGYKKLRSRKRTRRSKSRRSAKKNSRRNKL